MANRGSYVPPDYTPPTLDEPEDPSAPQPQNTEQQGYQHTYVPPNTTQQYSQQHQYPPQQQQQHYYPPQQDYQQQQQQQQHYQGQQHHYPPAGYPQYSHQDQYGYAQPEAVVYGASVDEPKRGPEHFSKQLNKLPTRMWHAISKPHLGNYNDLKTFATMEMTFFILMIIILWAIVIELIGFGIYGGSVGFAILAAIFGTLFFFFLSNFIFHILALWLGGGVGGADKTQMFVQLCYMILIFSFPLDLLNLLTFIPFLGGVIALALFIYKLYLTVLTIQAIYSVRVGHAIGILIAYILVIFIVVLCIWITVGYSFMLVLLRAA